MPSQESAPQNTVNPLKLIRVPGIILATLIVLQVVVQPLFMLQVPLGYGAVLAFGGSVEDTVYLEGPHFKLPWKHAIFMKLRTVADARETNPTDSNNQSIGATVVPQIWIEPSAIPALARNYGSFESLMKSVVEPQINQATRGNTSLHTPEELIWNRPLVVKGIRDSLQSAISEQLEAKGVDRNAVHVGLVAITQFTFSKAVRDTLEQKAESQVKTHTANARARIRAIEADKDGQVTEITADGDAEASRIIAEANAYKVQKVGEAAAAAADVAKYEAIAKWIEAGGHSSRIQLGNGAQVIINGNSPAPQAPRAAQ
jgi:regulator of protease activity HflC (stomatin/prohibitin superfamily)